jgi:tRNA threonylcarbamoyladenosine biosynthesis protein TsaB
MRLLGIDTATPNASVALVEDDKIIAEEFHGPAKNVGQGLLVQTKGNHAEIIVPLIQAILERTRSSLKELSGIAVSIGPGSFTGLRIALATVKGLAYESGLPVIGVSTLHANAARVTDSDGIICSMLDARKHEVYAACFRRRGASLTRLSEDRCCSLDSAIEMLRDLGSAGATVIGDGATVYAKVLTDGLGTELRLSAGTEYSTIGAQVAILAATKFDNSPIVDLATLSPVYLRSSEAEKKRMFSALTY